jgi:hypothetical protein
MKCGRNVSLFIDRIVSQPNKKRSLNAETFFYLLHSSHPAVPDEKKDRQHNHDP